MLRSHHDREKRPTRSLALVLLAWVFISGQALFAAGSIYNYQNKDKDPQAEKTTMPWKLLGHSAVKVRAVATQARPDVLTNTAVFLAVANALGVAALMCGLLSWSRSKHTSGKLTIAAAIAVILVNSTLNLPYA